MSMDYHSVHKVGFWLDKMATAYLVYQTKLEDGTVSDDVVKAFEKGDFWERAMIDALPEAYYDITQVRHICLLSDIIQPLSGVFYQEFTGDAKLLWPADSKTTPYFGAFNNEPIMFIPCQNQPDMFSPAYPNQQAVVDEVAAKFSAIGVQFPEDFDFKGHIVDIIGVAFY